MDDFPAVGEGARAPTELERYPAAAQPRTGLPPTPPEFLPPAPAEGGALAEVGEHDLA